MRRPLTGSHVRIAIISDHQGWPWAGCEELWSSLAHRALEGGHKVAVFLCRRNVPQARLQPLQKLGMELHLPPGAGTAIVQRTRRLSWKLANLISPLANPFQAVDRFRPDVVFYNGGDPIPNSVVLDQLERSRALRRPYVVMCHNSHFLDPPPSGEYRDAAIRFYQGARLVLAPATRTILDVEHILAARLAHTRIVRNPVNIKDTSVLPMPADSVVGIATIGRVSVRQKGLDILPAALASPGLKEKAWRLSFYGDGEDSDYLMRLAVHYGIPDRVAVRGHAGDIRAVWAENHVLALPSRFESAPLVVVEAMLCGRVCIVNDVGGVTDWIREPETGFVSAGLNAASFQAALERAWSVRSDWEAIGMRAHREALGLLDPDPGGTILKLLHEISNLTS